MRIAFGLALLSAACVFACGSSSSSSKGAAGSAGSDSTAGNSNSGGGSDSTGGTSSGGGMAGAIGEGGAADVPVVSTATPHTAGGIVAGGVVAHSAHFTGIFSLGAAPGGNGVLTSGTKQLRGGVIGASQK